MLKHTFVGAIYATLCLVPAPAEAGTFIGTLCTRIRGPIDMNDGYVEFLPGKTGTIKLNCSIDPFLLQGAGGRLLRLTHRDSTGTGTGAHVRSSLVRISKSTGAITKSLYFNSNQFAATGITFKTGSVPVWGINIDANFYFFEVELRRTTTLQIAGFYGGELVPPPPP